MYITADLKIIQAHFNEMNRMPLFIAISKKPTLNAMAKLNGKETSKQDKIDFFTNNTT